MNSDVHEKDFFLSIEVWSNYLQVTQFLASLILKLKLFCGVEALQILFFFLISNKFC